MEAQHNANCQSGRTVIVHLFEWKFPDIAAECERFLGPKGYCGVQTSPINEHRIVTSPWQPWWQRYQPVSYKIQSRSGSESQFKDMVSRCNNVGVRIFVDGVFNHMTGGGRGQGSGGSSFDAESLQFPGVPFGPTDFNCCNCGSCSTPNCEIRNYNDANQVRNCRLSGLRDLKVSKDYVRNKIADFMNKAIGYGVAGFRLDACKHMWPGDIGAILGRLNNLNSRWFGGGSRPFIFSEVIDLGGEPIKGTEYTSMGRVTEFRYGKELGDVIRRNRDQKLKFLKNFGEGWGMLASGSSLPFVDNHDNQRGHGAGGFGTILTFFEARWYKIANAFMMAWPYGQVRIMSSYKWDRNIQGGKDTNDWQGPPSEGNGNTKDVSINGDGTCGNGWVCEHRWRQIANMAKFRNVAEGQGVYNWWDNDNNQIAFSRGNKAFLVINNDDYQLEQTLQTGLPAGSYCDVISGNKEGGRCTGKVINVDGSSRAHFSISNRSDDPQVAIHVDAKL